MGLTELGTPTTSTVPPGKDARPRGEWIYDLLAPCLLLLTPFVVYLRHNHYGLLHTETILCYGGAVAAGLVLGLVVIRGGTVARILIMALLATYILDIQVIDLGRWTALAATFAFGAVAWLLRRQITRMATLIAAVMVLTTLFVPVGQPVARTLDSERGAVPRSDLPLILHLIVDEHIGIEGIPPEFDPEGRLAIELRDFFLKSGFELYGRAYSRYFDTQEAVSYMLNFDAGPTRSRYYAGPFKHGAVIAENAWFELLRQRGYQLHVTQSDYVRYAEPGAGGTRDGTRVVDYTTETVASLRTAPLAPLEKARFIIATYLRLLDLGTWAQQKYGNLRVRLKALGMVLPFWRESYTRTSTLASTAMFEDLRAQLRQATPGQAYVAHLMLPHYPYSYRADGRLRPRGGNWLFAEDRTKTPQRNDPESRARAYVQYLEQVRFTKDELARTFAVLQQIGLWDSAVIVVHGDHGSRLTLWRPTTANADRLSTTDLVDGFSTLFAVKRPGHPARYDRRLLPLGRLAARILRDSADPGDPDLENHPFVFLANGLDPMTKKPMPDFRRELAPGREGE